MENTGIGIHLMVALFMRLVQRNGAKKKWMIPLQIRLWIYI